MSETERRLDAIERELDPFTANGQPTIHQRIVTLEEVRVPTLTTPENRIAAIDERLHAVEHQGMGQAMGSYPPRKPAQEEDRGIMLGGEGASAPAVTELVEPRDPWAHRSKGMKCSTCMAYVEKRTEVTLGGAGPFIETKHEVTCGRCRNHSPTMDGYPVVFPADWCFDHKLDETKL